MSPPQNVLTIVGGDFNYVADKTDRWSKVSADWSHSPDHKEEGDWNKLFGGGDRCLHELFQPHGTHDNAGCAEAALQRAVGSERVGHPLALGRLNTLERDDGGAFGLFERGLAGDTCFAVDQHGAAAALTSW